MGKPALAAVVLEAWEYSTFILSNSPRRVVRNPRRSARLDVENMIPDATSNEFAKRDGVRARRSLAAVRIVFCNPENPWYNKFRAKTVCASRV